MDEARAVREFWFGTLPLSAASLEERGKLWFGGGAPGTDAARDAEIRERFGALLERAARGELASWADGPRRRLSLIIVLDQFPRSMFRGTARAFACDPQALALTISGMQSAADAALEPLERLFFYLPLQHAESREVQDESVAAYRRLLGEAPAGLRATLDGALNYAQLHHSIIERFGRFPHRNRALGRESTPAEVEWLRREDESFGQ